MIANNAPNNGLSTAPLKQFLGADDIELLKNHIEPLSFVPGDIILQQGKKSNGLYLITNGVVAITAKILGEGTTHIASLSTGSFLGEISLIDHGPCTTSAIANSDVSCIYLPAGAFDMLGLFHPQVKHKIMLAVTREIFQRLINLRNKIAESLSQSNMLVRSIFSEVMQSFSHPTIIPLEEANIAIKKLETLNIFSAFTPQEMDFLLKEVTVIKAPKQCQLIQEGEERAACYFILHGAVQCNIVHEGKSAKLSILGPMKLFGNVYSIDHALPSIINYTTCERAILMTFTESALNNIKQHNLSLWYKIFDLICTSFASLERAADKLEIRLNSETYNR